MARRELSFELVFLGRYRHSAGKDFGYDPSCLLMGTGCLSTDPPSTIQHLRLDGQTLLEKQNMNSERQAVFCHALIHNTLTKHGRMILEENVSRMT